MAVADLFSLRKFRPEPERAIDAAEARAVCWHDKDYCNEEGAHKLAERIAAYWQERTGRAVEFKYPTAGFHPALRAARVDLRSDLKNGWPAGYAPSPSEKR